MKSIGLDICQDNQSCGEQSYKQPHENHMREASAMWEYSKGGAPRKARDFQGEMGTEESLRETAEKENKAEPLEESGAKLSQT